MQEMPIENIDLRSASAAVYGMVRGAVSGRLTERVGQRPVSCHLTPYDAGMQRGDALKQSSRDRHYHGHNIEERAYARQDVLMSVNTGYFKSI